MRDLVAPLVVPSAQPAEAKGQTRSKDSQDPSIQDDEETSEGPCTGMAADSDTLWTWTGWRCGALTGAAILVCILQVMQVAIAELTQYQETGKHDFDNPYFSIWFNHSMTGLGCVCAVAVRYFYCSRDKSPVDILRAAGYPTVSEAFQDSLLLALPFQLLNICWAAAMDDPDFSVSIFIAIIQSSCVPVLALSVCFLHEQITRVKILAVVSCIVGVAVVSLRGNGGGVVTLRGLLWSFGCAGFNAAYVLLWAVKVGKKKQISGEDITLVMLSLVGLSTLLFMWWPLLVLHRLGIWATMVPAGHQWTLVASNAILAILNNMVYMLALTASSPLFISVGSVLSLPLSAAADYVFHGNTIGIISCLGYALIAFGFLALTLHGSQPQRGRNLATPPPCGPGYQH